MMIPNPNFHCHQHLHDQWVKMLMLVKPTHFITLNSNAVASKRKPYPVTFMYFELKAWEARVNRSLLGPKWQASPERMSGCAVLENATTNPHWHVLVRIHRPVLIANLKPVVQRHWKKLIPQGDIDVRHVYDAEGVIRYVLKEVDFAQETDLENKIFFIPT